MSEGGTVGIFWAVGSGPERLLVTASTPLAQAEPYGDFLTHPGGHFDTWEAWRVLGPDGLARRGLPSAIASHEYEHFPRGRVVFHRLAGRFTAYADRRLLSAACRARIISTFALPPARTGFATDAHYRTGHDLRGDHL